jgi:hypothetical protein
MKVAIGPAEVAVIGAGIAGSIAACLLCDRGLSVLLVDPHGTPMSAVSRWNEGKLHLGYTYTGTDSLETARLMIEGTAQFERILGDVCGKPLDPSWWSRPIVYVVDRDSIFPVELLWARAEAVGQLVKRAASRVEAISRFEPLIPRRLMMNEVAALTGGQRNAAAWITGERSISTTAVADMVVAAVRDREINVVRARVHSVRRTGHLWSVECGDGSSFESRSVLNCSWESRWLLDRAVKPETGEISIRHKVALFGLVPKMYSQLQPSTRILGAFGDVTPYGDGNAYLSWYPAGLLAHTEDGLPPMVTDRVDRDMIISKTLSALGLEDFSTLEWTVQGGFVVAAGKGRITDPRSSLHERHRARAALLAPNYVSVDTGKYTVGPLLAEQAVNLLLSTWTGP